MFTVYSVGMFSSAWAGHMAAHRGRRAVLLGMVVLMAAGVLITMAHPTWAVFAGLAVMTFGFFGAHAVVSAWIGASAHRAKAVASSFYLFCYYAGSSVIGTSAGVFWSAYGWPGVTAIVGALLCSGVGGGLCSARAARRAKYRSLQRNPRRVAARLRTIETCTASQSWVLP